MFKTIKGIIFLLNVLLIFGTEFLLYSLFLDYGLLIDRLTLRLSSINILCVKIFQAFALNNSLINEETNNKLLQFTDNAPWSLSDINLHDLIEIADKYNLHLKFGYEIPINAGMISLVFKVYKSNTYLEPVIIKMKRNNIDKKLDDAIDNLLFLMYILSFIPIINKYQLAEVEKFFSWYNKIKNINELDSDNYWKRTNSHIYKIKERIINIARTLQEIEK